MKEFKNTITKKSSKFFFQSTTQNDVVELIKNSVHNILYS